MAGALLSVPVYNIPAGLVLGTIALTFFQTRKALTVNTFWITWAMFSLSCLLMVHVLTGRGFAILASGGYVLAFTFVFYALFSVGPGISMISIVRGISFLYKFYLFGMIIETIIILLGKQPLLVKLFSSTQTPGYKAYNSADVARFFGLMQDAGGLNSVLLGSQIAGMLSLFATIWFIGIRNTRINKSLKDGSSLWIILSFLIFLISANGTTLLLFTLGIVIYGVFICRKHRFLSLSIISLSLVGWYLAISSGYLLTRIFADSLYPLSPDEAEIMSNYRILDEVSGLTQRGYYMYMFFRPVELWLSGNWVDKLIGVGAQYLIDDSVFVPGDFGFGITVFTSGFVWILLFVATVFRMCIPALRLAASGPNERQVWSALGSINALIALLWLFSNVHYNQAVANPGGMMLFALHFALTTYCRKRFREYPDSAVIRRRVAPCSKDQPGVRATSI